MTDDSLLKALNDSRSLRIFVPKLNFFTFFYDQAFLVDFRLFWDSDLKAVPSAFLCTTRLTNLINFEPKSH